ncbi:MAG: PilZ domain-containing protein [Planctomycetota bacterium]
MFFHKKRVAKFTCRREQERAALPDADSLVVELDLPDGMTVPAELYDLTIEGSGVLVPEEFVMGLVTDDVLQFTLAHPINGWTVQTPARVVRNVPHSHGSHMLGMQFINTGNLYAQLDDAMGRYFNRRRLGRVHPDENQTIDVHISHGSDQILGRIYDISEQGIGIAVPFVQGLSLAPGDELQVKFRLPNSTKPVQGVITVQQRRMLGEYGFVGAKLDDQFDKSRPVILDFIAQRRLASEEFEHSFDDEPEVDGIAQDLDAA